MLAPLVFGPLFDLPCGGNILHAGWLRKCLQQDQGNQHAREEYDNTGVVNDW
jgi:hypothetical protein